MSSDKITNVWKYCEISKINCSEKIFHIKLLMADSENDLTHDDRKDNEVTKSN